MQGPISAHNYGLLTLVIITGIPPTILTACLTRKGSNTGEDERNTQNHSQQ